MEILDSPEMIQLVNPLPEEHVKDCLERRVQLLTQVLSQCGGYELVIDTPYDEDTNTYDLVEDDLNITDY